MPAKIEPPALPIYLYRYRSLHRRAGEMGNILAREIETLRRSYIWCSKFIALNDPMEGFYRPSSAIKKKSNYDQIAALVSAGKSGVGIASLSDTKKTN